MSNAINLVRYLGHYYGTHVHLVYFTSSRLVISRNSLLIAIEFELVAACLATNRIYITQAPWLGKTRLKLLALRFLIILQF